MSRKSPWSHFSPFFLCSLFPQTYIYILLSISQCLINTNCIYYQYWLHLVRNNITKINSLILSVFIKLLEESNSLAGKKIAIIYSRCSISAPLSIKTNIHLDQPLIFQKLLAYCCLNHRSYILAGYRSYNLFFSSFPKTWLVTCLFYMMFYCINI